MTERAGYGVKRNYKVLNWEQNDFPILCENCLGESQHIRLLKKHLGAECKICARPCTVFNWRPSGPKAKPRRTEICSTCAKINNCCQSCVYDLDHNLPIDVRNKLMGDKKVELLVSEGNRDIFTSLFEANNRGAELPYNQTKMLKHLGETEADPEEPKADRDVIKNKFKDLNPEQKEVLQNMEVSKKIVEGLDQRTVYIKYIVDSEVGFVKSKILSIFDSNLFSVEFEDNVLRVDFNDPDDAEKFMKIYGNNMIIKGKKLTLDWTKSPAKVYSSKTRVDPPSSLPKNNKLNDEDIKKLVINNIDKLVK